MFFARFSHVFRRPLTLIAAFDVAERMGILVTEERERTLFLLGGCTDEQTFCTVYRYPGMSFAL
jgi:hypothetical protein